MRILQKKIAATISVENDIWLIGHLNENLAKSNNLINSVKYNQGKYVNI